jgi:hypothetical protein
VVDSSSSVCCQFSSRAAVVTSALASSTVLVAAQQRCSSSSSIHKSMSDLAVVLSKCTSVGACVRSGGLLVLSIPTYVAPHLMI